MTKFLFVTGIIAVSAIANPASSRQAGPQEPADSTTAFRQWAESLPDSVRESLPADTLKSFFNNCILLKSGMPVFTPDTELTENMPQFNPPGVDKRMIIPRFKKWP